MTPIKTALAGLAAWPRFFVWRLSDWNGYKFESKTPWTGAEAFDAKAAYLQNQLLTFDAANAQLQQFRAHAPAGVCYSLGWYFMLDAGYWFLDLDQVVSWPDPSQPGAGAPILTPLAQEAWQLLAQSCVFWEFSSSMRGLHFIGRGNLPAHKVKGKGLPEQLELYSQQRGICFGLSGFAGGCADIVQMPPAHWIVPANHGDDAFDLSARMPEWQGPEDDDELIRRMLARSEAATRLRGGVTLQGLWNAEPDALEKYPGRSEADGALASHLAWWTGADVPRMIRLMWRSGLVRDKWSDPSHRTYLKITAESAATDLLCSGRSCYVERPKATAVVSILPPPPTLAPVTSVQPGDEFRGVPGALEIIVRAGNSDELKDAARRIAAMQQWDAADVEAIAQRLRRKSKELIGDFWPITLCRRMVSGLAGDDVGPGEAHGAPGWLDEWAFVANQNKYCNIASEFDCISKEALHVTLFNKPEIPYKNNGDKEEAARMLNMWGVQVVNDIGYNPKAGLIFTDGGRTLLNRFHNSLPDMEFDGNPQAIEIYKQHLWNVAGHDAENFQMLLRWMGHIVQFPGKLIRWAVLMIGAHGTGKTAMSAPLQAALGSRNVQLGSAKGVNNGGGFMDWVARQHLLGVVSDFSVTGINKFETSEAIKPVISDDLVSITLKGKADIVYKNYASYIMSTNVREPFPMAATERRWFVLFTTWLDEMVANRPQEAARYFQNLEWAIKALTPGQWRGFFASIEVGELPAVAPKTAAMHAIVGNSVNEAMQALRECVEGFDVVTTNKLTDALRGIDGAPSKKALSRAMNDLGFDYYEKARLRVQGGNKTGIYLRTGRIPLTADWEEIKALATEFCRVKDAAKFEVIY